MSIGVYGNGDVYVTHHGTNYYNKLTLTNFTAISGGNFLFGGRTGGENARQLIDNLSINTFLEVTQAPTNAPPTTGIKLTATKAGNNLTVSWSPTGGKLQSTPALAGATTVWTDAVRPIQQLFRLVLLATCSCGFPAHDLSRTQKRPDYFRSLFFAQASALMAS